MRFRVTVFSERDGVSSIVVEAQNESGALAQVSGQGVSVLSVRPERLAFSLRLGRGGRFPLLALTQELLALVRAGVGLVEAFETLAEKEQAGLVRGVLQQVLRDLRGGKSLSVALEAHPGIFPPLYVASVRASERSGNLVDALARYVAYRQQVETAAKKAITALVYPALLLGVGLLVTLFLLVYVVPRFSRVFEERVADLPMLTQLLIGWGRILNEHPWESASIALLTVVLLGFAAGHQAVHAAGLRLLQSLPRVGERIRLLQLARLYRTLGMLLRGGIPAVTALVMVRDLMQAGALTALDRATRRVREGIPMSVAMADAGLTTPVAARMLRVGEQTGDMGEMMERLADLLDEDNARALEIFSRTFEPALMALIGLVIGGIVVLMYLPIFELASSVR